MTTLQRLGLAVGLAVLLAEGLVVQPVRVWGPLLVDDPVRMASLVDLVRAILWVGGAVVGALGFAVGRMPVASDAVEPQKRRWLWTMLDTFTEGMVGFDHDGRVVFANQSALRMLRRSALPDGTPMAAFSDYPRLRTTVAHALLDGRMETVELRTPDSATTLLARAAPCDEGALLLMVDITVERETVEAREAFLSDAAHELRTPVTAVKLGLEALDMGGIDEPAMGRRMLEGMSRQAERMELLLEDLLSLARLESGAQAVEVEQVAVQALFDHVQDGLDDPRVEWESTDLRAFANEAAVEQVVDNLVRNALAYSSDTVLVRASAGDVVRIEVVDHGPGIADPHKEKVFQRFFRTDDGRARRMGGTGLGLAIVRELVLRMDGGVWVEDTPGGGATFVVQLRGAG